MKWIWSRLPGPLPVRVLEAILVAAVILVALGFLFEWAGGLLDSGGAVSAP